VPTNAFLKAEQIVPSMAAQISADCVYILLNGLCAQFF